MNKRLIEHLRQNGYVDEMQLRSALARQQQFGGDVIDLLLRLKMLSERDCARGLASFYRYPVVDLNQTTPEEEALALIDGDYARTHSILPLQVDRETRMVDVAVFDPARSLDALDFVRRRAGLEPRPHITPPTALGQAISYFYFGGLPDPASEPGSASSASRSLHLDGEAARRSPSGGFNKAVAPRAAIRSGRRGRGFDRGLREGETTGSFVGPVEAESVGLGGHAVPLDRSGPHKIGALVEPPSVASEVDHHELVALQKRVERLEELLEHERRVVQTLVEVLIETGLASREELVKRTRDST